MSLPSNTVMIAVGAVLWAVYSVYLISWGDRHGFNAHRVAAITAELAAVNADLKVYKERDDAAASAADARLTQQTDAALAAVTEKCVISPALAAAINGVGAP